MYPSHSLKVMATLSIPDFTGPLTLDAITIFFTKCTDAFTIYDKLNPPASGTSLLTVYIKVLLAGLHLKEPSTAQWWNVNRSKPDTEFLSNFTSFADVGSTADTDFASSFKKRFLLLNPKLEGSISRSPARHDGGMETGGNF